MITLPYSLDAKLQPTETALSRNERSDLRLGTGEGGFTAPDSHNREYQQGSKADEYVLYASLDSGSDNEPVFRLGFDSLR